MTKNNLSRICPGLTGKLVCLVVLIVSGFSAYAEGASESDNSWYKILGGIIAIPATLVGIYYSLVQIKKTTLEIANAQLDLEERRRKILEADPGRMLVTDAPPVPSPLSLSDPKSSGRNAIEIGFLCLALPVILVLGSLWLDYEARIQVSISAYYYTSMRNVYVALHAFIAILLFNYTEIRLIDRVVYKLESLLCISIVLFPTSLSADRSDWISMLHYSALVVFFLLQAYFSSFLFPRIGNVNNGKSTARKRIYRICSTLIVLSVLLIFFIPALIDEAPHVTLLLETIVYWAIGTSWLVRGAFLLRSQ